LLLFLSAQRGLLLLLVQPVPLTWGNGRERTDPTDPYSYSNAGTAVAPARLQASPWHDLVIRYQVIISTARGSSS